MNLRVWLGTAFLMVFVIGCVSKSDVEKVLSDHPEIIFNIIRNAAQAIENEGSITVRSRVNGTKAIVEIADTGAGMDETHLKKIFNPFFTTKEPGKGTGLGLFIVKQIIERNEGSISATSVPGQGTTFRLTFKLADKAENVQNV